MLQYNDNLNLVFDQCSSVVPDESGEKRRRMGSRTYRYCKPLLQMHLYIEATVVSAEPVDEDQWQTSLMTCKQTTGEKGTTDIYSTNQTFQ
jgi:hypothetical protein